MVPNIPEIKNPERFAEFDLPKSKLEYALKEALKKIDFTIPEMTYKFPKASSINNVYPAVENNAGWQSGFWTGMLWHAYELTGDEKYKKVALGQIPSYTKRIVERLNVDHHDMGFVYSPSCVAAWKLVGDEEAKKAAIMAAENLRSRYHEVGSFIQAWGAIDDPTKYRLIIDCLLNIPLLYWASEATGDPTFDEIGFSHFNTTVGVCWRPDGSTHHTYYFDIQTGEPTMGVTKQGASNNSAWSRGQAWGIYGPMLTYTYKKNESAMQRFKVSTNYFLNHLPADYVAYWDLIFTDGDDEPRDSSADAIAICGILEGIKHMDESDPLRKIYENAAKRMMNSLIDNYLTKDVPEANGLLLHATYSKPDNLGIDEMNIWGDYFYMEALHRILNPDWRLYW